MVAAVCSNCGEQNAPGTRFCVFCNAYLGWDDAPAPPPTGPPVTDPRPTDPRLRDPRPSEAKGTAPPPVGGEGTLADPTATVIRSAPDQAPPRTAQGLFEAVIEVAEATVPVDGSPAIVAVNVSNTSTVVDSYVLEAVEPPPWLQASPGQTELLPSTSSTLMLQLRVVSQTMVPAQHLSLLVRVRNITGQSAHTDLPVRVTVPVVEAPVEMRAEPQVVRTRDAAPGMCTVVIRNIRSNRWAQVQLAATDPEQVVRATWNPPRIQIPPGGEVRADLRLDAPPPDPGGEVSRMVTITASDGHLHAETTVTLVQSASRAAIDLLSIGLDPSVLRLGERRRGRLKAVVDNRHGTGPVSLSLRGIDPEGKMHFNFNPPTLNVQAGGRASAHVTVTTQRIPPGEEVSRPLTIVASDGRGEIRAEATVIQMASSLRVWARIILTLLGGLAMILGALLPFLGDPHDSAVGLSAEDVAMDVRDTHPDFGIPDQINAGGFEHWVSIGLIFIFLGGLVILGLTGPTGKMTRRSALLGLVLAIAFLIAMAALAGGSGPSTGGVLIVLGCLLGYAGGLLARR